MSIMQKIGTHNSLSYHLPQWWMIPFMWIARCQSSTLEEQYELGVRYFDIRPKLVDGKMVAGHGLATYNVDMESVWKFLNDKGDCIVRIFCESGDKQQMIDYVNDIMSRYTNIQYVGGYQRYMGKIVNLPDIEEVRYYWEKDPDTKFCIPFPWLYAVRHNKENKQFVNEDVYSVFDFVNI